ncbi:MAG: tRNA-dihydrouridine synthase family protein [archaeon]|nr:tRNA-dihydrouridine synthase family protein [archaeon]
MQRLDPKKLFQDPHHRFIFAFAPLEPFTANPIVREYAGICGAQLVFRPKINPHQLLKAKEWQNYEQIKNLSLIKTPSELSVYDGIQLIARPDDPIKGAVRFISQNKKEIGVSFIDLNFSCPGHKVLPHNRGGELLKYPEKIRQVVEKSLKFTSLPVSVKIRSGYTIKDNPKEVLKVLKEFDLAWITVNRAPVKRGNVDFEVLKTDISYFQQTAEIIDDKFPFIANGDLNKIERINQLNSIKSCQGVMIGRGALGNPDIFFKLSHNSKIKKQNFSEETIEVFSRLFKIINKYREGESGRWTSIAQLKSVLFFFIKHYKESQGQQLPHGYGEVQFIRKTKFTQKSLIEALYQIFPFIPLTQWEKWIIK